MINDTILRLDARYHAQTYTFDQLKDDPELVAFGYLTSGYVKFHLDPTNADNMRRLKAYRECLRKHGIVIVD